MQFVSRDIQLPTHSNDCFELVVGAAQKQAAQTHMTACCAVATSLPTEQIGKNYLPRMTLFIYVVYTSMS